MTIQTFIFFDLETTGLIQGKVIPRITEIALVAVAREAICDSSKNVMPRILHKMVLPINPQKVIPPKVEYLTRLCNEDMRMLHPFTCETYELIINFLQHLTPPICFAAHKGNEFDYPIFLRELERIDKVLDNEILCIDTWEFFKDYFRKEETNGASCLPNPKIIVEDMFDDGYNELLSAALDKVMMEEEAEIAGNNITAFTSQILSSEHMYTRILDGKYSTNEEHDNITRPLLNYKQDVSEKTPKNQIIKMQDVFPGRPHKKNNNLRRRLDFDSKRPVNLKLAAIYEYMFGSNFACQHSAEADCLAMIRCVTQVADFFLEWSDNHATSLVHYKKRCY